MVCTGGAGAQGPLDNSWEHGSQDFNGVIDEVRIWRTARSADQIFEVHALSSHVYSPADPAAVRLDKI